MASKRMGRDDAHQERTHKPTREHQAHKQHQVITRRSIGEAHFFVAVINEKRPRCHPVQPR